MGFKGDFEAFVEYLGQFYIRVNNKALALIDVGIMTRVSLEIRDNIKILDPDYLGRKQASSFPFNALGGKQQQEEQQQRPASPAPAQQATTESAIPHDRQIEFLAALKEAGDAQGVPFAEMQRRFATMLASPDKFFKPAEVTRA